jgi:hypothetical protein
LQPANPEPPARQARREVRFDPAQQRFARDEEANAMLAGAYREPFIVPDKV